MADDNRDSNRDNNGRPVASPFRVRLRRMREQAGMTRTVLGELAGRSGSWVKALEVGRLQQPRLPMLIRLAEILGVDDLVDLTGEPALSRASYGKPVHPALPAISEALASYPMATGDTEPESPEVLSARTRQAWELWHRSRHQRSAVATVLPGLLGDARRSVQLLDGNNRRSVSVSLAQVYHLAQLYLSFQPVASLVLLAGDRAMTAAQDADNPHAVAAAAWYVNHVYRDAGEQHEARVQLAREADRMLDPERGPEDLALHGLLELAMALSYAKVGREGDTWRHWDTADKAARALDRGSSLPGGYHHPWLMFGRSMVDAYAITIQTDLMRGGYAVRQANKVNLALMPSATRRSFHLAETARAHYLRSEPLATVTMLAKAHQESPDTLGFSLFARTAVPELVEHGGTTVRPDAERLAAVLGLAV